MRIRDVNIRDLVLLEPCAKFPLDNYNHLYPIKGSLEIDGELIGSFFVKLTSETSLIFAPEVSSLNRARALKEIFHLAAKRLVDLGLNDNHIFLKDQESLGKILKKHFGFEDVVGTPLVLRGVK
jgi:hypothetical protein